MPQLTDDCFAHGGKLMTVDEALAMIDAVARPVTDSERVDVGRAAGRILA